jgi:RNA-binding protein PNO1
MPAPTALKAAPVQQQVNNPIPADSQDDDILLDAPDATSAAAAGAEGEAPQQPATDMQLDDAVDEEGRPRFAPSSARAEAVRVEHRKVPIPPHRMTPLKASWPKIYPPLVEHLKLQCRMNMKSKAVELRTSKATTDNGAIQKGADFVRAFALGFDVDDAIALLRMDDLYIETFEIKVCWRTFPCSWMYFETYYHGMIDADNPFLLVSRTSRRSRATISPVPSAVSQARTARPGMPSRTPRGRGWY